MPPSRRRPPPTFVLHLALATLAVAWWAWLSPPNANDLAGGDEGYYGVMARNLLASPRQWPLPALTPLGSAGDKPPLYPALIALAVRALGATPLAVRLVSLLSAIVILLASARLARALAGERAALAALLLLATLPWFADAARVAAGELPLAAFACVALAVLASGRPSLARGAVAGLLFGAAFLCKLWLVALLALPALVLLWPLRPRAALAGVALGAVAVVVAHILLLQGLRPDLLKSWWNVVTVFSLRGRAAGAGYAPYWFHGRGFYAATLARAFVLALPLLALALFRALRSPREPASRFAFATLAGLALLTAFRVQSGGYLLPLVPCVAIVAAGGYAWLAASDSTPRKALAALLLVAALAGGAWRISERLPQRYHATGYRDIATALAPGLASSPPARPALIAPEGPAFAFQLFRTARGWDTPYEPWTTARATAVQADTGYRAFVVDTRQRWYGGWPDSSMLAWLVAHTHEVTGDIERQRGKSLAGLRVFVR